MKLAELLREAATELPKAEAEALVLGAFRKEGLKLSRFDLYSRGNDPAPVEVIQQVRAWTLRRKEGIPLQHLTQTQGFLDHEYEVSSAVLIPRPETEVLATLAMEELSRLHGSEGPKLGWEVGLGSGILSIEFLSRFSSLRMLASEVSPEAQKVALRNARSILEDPSRLEVLLPENTQSVLSVFPSAPTPEFIISNPPYLKEFSDELTDEVAKHEPALALFAPQDDLLYFYRRIAEDALPLQGGVFRLFLELPHERAEKIAALFKTSGWQLQLHTDLHGRSRVLVAQ